MNALKWIFKFLKCNRLATRLSINQQLSLGNLKKRLRKPEPKLIGLNYNALKLVKKSSSLRKSYSLKPNQS